jgi:CDP-2,3-bis-(O-geranylgeranyl)-sn-glycerol synthase
MLPAYFANMAPVIVRRWTSFLDFPVDFGAKFGGKPLFGKNKTFRGFFFGIIFALLLSYLQHALESVEFFSSISIIDYSGWNWALIGILMGAGALLGDLVKSFFKRRIGVKPGERFFLFDQVDFVIGALLLIALIYVPPISLIITIILLSILLHVIVNHAAYYLKIRKEKW